MLLNFVREGAAFFACTANDRMTVHPTQTHDAPEARKESVSSCVDAAQGRSRSKPARDLDTDGHVALQITALEGEQL